MRILVSSLDLASCLGSFFHKLGASTYSWAQYKLKELGSRVCLHKLKELGSWVCLLVWREEQKPDASQNTKGYPCAALLIISLWKSLYPGLSSFMHILRSLVLQLCKGSLVLAHLLRGVALPKHMNRQDRLIPIYQPQLCFIEGFS